MLMELHLTLWQHLTLDPFMHWNRQTSPIVTRQGMSARTTKPTYSTVPM